MLSLKKVFIWISGLAFLFFAGVVLYVAYLSKETRSQSAQFCDNVVLGIDVATIYSNAMPYGPYKLWLVDQSDKLYKVFDQKNMQDIKNENLSNEIVRVVFRAKVPPTCICSIKLEQGKVISKKYQELD